MTNLFLPPFPQVGYTQDYVDAINNIFTTFATHTHVPIVVNGNPTYPAGNQLENDSVNWTESLSVSSIINAFSISFTNPFLVNPSAVIPDNSLFIQLPYNDLYFKKVGVVSPIQITNRNFVDASVLINGVRGSFQPYSVSLYFSNETNDYTFTWVQFSVKKLLDIYSLNLTLNTLICQQSYTTNLTVPNAPNLTPLSGYAFLTNSGKLTYSQVPIYPNIIATSLLFDNLVTYYQPPVLETYPNIPSVITATNLVRYPNGENGNVNPIITPYYYQPYVWAPIYANDEKVAGFIKATFYVEPFSQKTVPAWQNTESMTLATSTERWVWTLVPETLVSHYTFNLYQGNANSFPPLPVTNWNDCLWQNEAFNESQGGETFLLVDIGGAAAIPFGFKFHYFYNLLESAV